jgi:hypothetical protein
MGGFAITLIMKKYRDGGNIPNIFMGIKTCIANIFEALGSFICFVDVVAIVQSLQPFDISFVVNMVDNFFIANNFKALDTSYFTLHVGNIASLEACMFFVCSVVVNGFSFAKGYLSKVWGGGGEERCQSKGSCQQKKRGEQTSIHQGGFCGKHIGRSNVMPLLKVEFLCISRHWTRGHHHHWSS